MEIASALWIIEHIYATFGKQPPKQSSPQFQLLYDNIRELPNECARYIVRKAAELDDMPRNLSKFCVGAWRDWQFENGSSFENSCQTCNGAGGWTYFKKVNGTDGPEWHEFFSPCPACTYVPQRLREKIRLHCKPKWQLEREGCIIVPEDYEGGVVQFASDHGYGPKIRTMDRNVFAAKWQGTKAAMALEMSLC